MNGVDGITTDHSTQVYNKHITKAKITLTCKQTLSNVSYNVHSQLIYMDNNAADALKIAPQLKQ